MSGFPEELPFRTFVACFLEVLRGVAFFVDLGSILGSFWEGFGVPSAYFGALIFEVDLGEAKRTPKSTKSANLRAHMGGPAECAGPAGDIGGHKSLQKTAEE